jgi:hypothetical protein
MKRIFTLFTTLILTISLFAAARPKAMLTIKSADQSDIRVVIDGRRFEPYANYMRIQDMQPGYHSIRVYRERNFGIFTIFGSRYDVVFSNSMMIKPGTNVMISIDRFGRAQVLESRTRGRGYDWDDRGWKNDHNYDFDNGRNYGDYGDRDRNMNERDSKWGDRNDRNGGFGTNNGGYGNNNGGYGNGNSGGYGNDGGYGNGNYSKAMPDIDFNRVLDNISRERFENNMLKSATQVINSNYFTSMQVKQMLHLFSFETNKLDLAKLAYDKTVDQRSYSVVNDEFSYTTSRDELARYIRSH